MLILLLKILFCLLVISHTIRWVIYHLRHLNKKTRVFHGNTRMPFDLEFALMYGMNAKLKSRFKVKDLSYRKTLLQWKLLLNEIYPADNELNINSDIRTEPKSPLGDLGVATGNNNLTRIKKIYNVFMAKPCAKNKSFVAPFLFNTKIIAIKNLKNSQNPIPFVKQIVACYYQNLRFAFF